MNYDLNYFQFLFEHSSASKTKVRAKTETASTEVKKSVQLVNALTTLLRLSGPMFQKKVKVIDKRTDMRSSHCSICICAKVY